MITVIFLLLKLHKQSPIKFDLRYRDIGVVPLNGNNFHLIALLLNVKFGESILDIKGCF